MNYRWRCVNWLHLSLSLEESETRGSERDTFHTGNISQDERRERASHPLLSNDARRIKVTTKETVFTMIQWLVTRVHVAHVRQTGEVSEGGGKKVPTDQPVRLTLCLLLNSIFKIVALSLFPSWAVSTQCSTPKSIFRIHQSQRWSHRLHPASIGGETWKVQNKIHTHTHTHVVRWNINAHRHLFKWTCTHSYMLLVECFLFFPSTHTKSATLQSLLSTWSLLAD